MNWMIKDTGNKIIGQITKAALAAPSITWYRLIKISGNDRHKTPVLRYVQILRSRNAFAIQLKRIGARKRGDIYATKNSSKGAYLDSMAHYSKTLPRVYLLVISNDAKLSHVTLSTCESMTSFQVSLPRL